MVTLGKASSNKQTKNIYVARYLLRQEKQVKSLPTEILDKKLKQNEGSMYDFHIVLLFYKVQKLIWSI